MDLKEMGWEGIDWIDLAHDRNMWQTSVNEVMNLRVPLNATNFSTSQRIVSLSRRILLHGVRYFIVFILLVTIFAMILMSIALFS